jgi:hypothetical protein
MKNDKYDEAVDVSESMDHSNVAGNDSKSQGNSREQRKFSKLDGSDDSAEMKTPESGGRTPPRLDAKNTGPSAGLSGLSSQKPSGSPLHQNNDSKPTAVKQVTSCWRLLYPDICNSANVIPQDKSLTIMLIYCLVLVLAVSMNF